ncbi:MAG: response regulator [Nostoc sp.]|uniref:response regulator n=1 Tax=Nostoc sp. TaxID=1180 RepID=UPI002FF4D478
MNLINGFCLAAEILKSVQVLVVDNDRDSRDLYAFVLKDQSTNVITAGSVKEALKILSWFTPNIIVCEIRFLGESIYTLLNTLTAMEADNGNHIPIIVTSTSTTGTHDLIPNVEFEEYLLKPFDLDKFVSLIRNQVEKVMAKNSCPNSVVLPRSTKNFMTLRRGSVKIVHYSESCRLVINPFKKACSHSLLFNEG